MSYALCCLFCAVLSAGRRPAFGINSVTALGRQSLAEIAAEAAEMAVVAEARSPYGATAGASPAAAAIAATMSKSLLALAALSLGVPIVPQVRQAVGAGTVSRLPPGQPHLSCDT